MQVIPVKKPIAAVCCRALSVIYCVGEGQVVGLVSRKLLLAKETVFKALLAICLSGKGSSIFRQTQDMNHLTTCFFEPILFCGLRVKKLRVSAKPVLRLINKEKSVFFPVVAPLFIPDGLIDSLNSCSVNSSFCTSHTASELLHLMVVIALWTWTLRLLLQWVVERKCITLLKRKLMRNFNLTTRFSNILLRQRRRGVCFRGNDAVQWGVVRHRRHGDVNLLSISELSSFVVTELLRRNLNVGWPLVFFQMVQNLTERLLFWSLLDEVFVNHAHLLSVHLLSAFWFI